MDRLNSKYVFLLVAGFSLIALCFAFQARSSEPTTISNEDCLDCHEDVPNALVGTAHDPFGDEAFACVSCHAGPATEMHVDDPDEAKPIVPAKLSADSTSAICTACHKDPHALNLYERDPHIYANLSCGACHEIHSNNEHAPLLKAEENTVCLDCHASVRSAFALPTHHPVMEDVIACRDCHTEIAQSPKQRTVGGPGETCVECHAIFQGPFPYEHEAAVYYSINDGGCLNCHSPHGSEFPMLLEQSYEPPHFSLCSQCHVVPKHLNNLKHGTMWAGVPCNECHTDVHGSYTSPHLLDASLESQGCLKAGCHQ